MGIAISQGRGVGTGSVSDVGVLANVAIGKTARSVNKGAPQGVAEPAANGAEPIDALMATEAVAVRRGASDAIAKIAALEIGLDTVDYGAALEIIADLAAAEAALRLGAAGCIASRKAAVISDGIAAIAPAVAAVDARVEPCPALIDVGSGRDVAGLAPGRDRDRGRLRLPARVGGYLGEVHQ